MAKTSLDKSKIRIVLFEGIHQSAVDALLAEGYSNIEQLKTSLEGEALIEKLQDAHFVGVRSRTQLTAPVLAKAKKLIAIGCFCIGTNQVDLATARERGIVVFNAPYSNTRSVAELVLGEAIILMRGIAEKNALAHRGIWNKSAANSYELRGKTLGLVGYGSIGSQLSVLAESLGMKVIFFDVVNKLPLGNASQVGSLTELVQTADVISLHVPETPATKDMIGSEQLKEFKRGSVLINASRGTVIDIPALAQALRDKHLLGAAIDVFPVEPKSNADAFESPLQEFDNCLLTPHVGGSTMEAQANIGAEVALKLIKYSDNGSTVSSVNLPDVALPAHPGVHRLLHIHQNVPGVLSEINNIFSANSINISAQYLQTNEKVGYVVIDVDAASSDLALQKISKVKGTIRSRLLY